MKTTRKIGFLTLLLAGTTFAGMAQSPSLPASSKQEFRLSVGPETGIPIGNFSDSYKWNLGGSVQIDIPVITNLYVTVNAGYNNFFVKKDQRNVPDKNMQLIPVKAGLKYFPGGGIF